MRVSLYTLDGRLQGEADNRAVGSTDYMYLGSTLVARRFQHWSGIPPVVTYHHSDALGSPVAVSNAGGQLQSREWYTSYGAPADGATEDQIGYTGHQSDPVTGLVYAQQRYYDPAIGRFLSVDPMMVNSNTGAMFNRYSYANNNPYRYTDPDGRCYTSTGQCMTSEEFDEAWKGEASLVLNTLGSPLGIVADMLGGDFEGAVFGLALSKVPGGRAAKQSGFFVRFGKKAETVEELAAGAAAAKKAPNVGVHGVSVKFQQKVSEGTRAKHRVADAGKVQKEYNVKQTGKDPNHHTVELPEPVTEMDAKRFNEVFR